MKIYSKTTEAFIKRALEDTRLIFMREIQPILDVTFTKKWVHFQFHSMRLKIVVFDDNSRLGYYNSNRCEIGLSKKLIYRALDEVYLNILRHEILHFLTHATVGAEAGHGHFFRDLGEKLNWGEKVISAKSNIEIENGEIEQPNQKNREVMEKVKKLLNLATSDNKHESEIATYKANQLIMEYNLSLHSTFDDDEEVCVLTAISYKRKSPKMSAIAQILDHFYVSTVFSAGEGLVIVGTRLNVELAHYVANFLNTELDFLYASEAKKNHQLFGLAAKNSFFRGVAIGYSKKMAKLKSTQTSEQVAGLIKLEASLEKQLARAFPSLGFSVSHAKHDQNAGNLGSKAGENLHIRQGINSSSNNNAAPKALGMH